MHAALSPRLWKWINGLGLGGLLPFFALAALSVAGAAPEHQVMAEDWIYVYGLSIVSFVGAVSFGLALADSHADEGLRVKWLVWSVCPSLLACAVLFLPAWCRPFVLGLIAIAALAMDYLLQGALADAKPWLRLRTVLTTGAVLSLWTVSACGIYRLMQAHSWEMLLKAG
jgi:hypothetical protein